MMDSPTESCVPPGFRFHPTDEELVGYYLRKKMASQKIDLDVIREIDLYRIEPWDLQDKCGIGYEEQKEWYFFSHKDKKYPTGTRTNRATMAGFWKATGRDKAVFDRSKLIGMRKTLVFYKGRAPNGHKTDWITHEYRLEPPQEEGWVVCRAFKKRTTGQSKTSIDGWEYSTCYNDEMMTPNFPSHSLADCKNETADNLDFMMQLPQLESPSLRPHSAELDSNNINNLRGMVNSKKVTDWRDLDRFVASQLSHGDGLEAGPGFGDSDLALLLLQNGSEEAGPKLNEISTSECDIGIRIFNK